MADHNPKGKFNNDFTRRMLSDPVVAADDRTDTLSSRLDPLILLSDIPGN